MMCVGVSLDCKSKMRRVHFEETSDELQVIREDGESEDGILIHASQPYLDYHTEEGESV